MPPAARRLGGGGDPRPRPLQAAQRRAGPSVGDEVLRATAGALGTVVRGDDLVARVGGEEFALVLPGAGHELAWQVAERAAGGLAQIRVPGFALTGSAGIACFPVDAPDPATLFERADGALYGPSAGAATRRAATTLVRAPVPSPTASAPRWSTCSPARRDHARLPAARRSRLGPARGLRGALALRRPAGPRAGRVVRPGPPLRPRSRARGRALKAALEGPAGPRARSSRST